MTSKPGRNLVQHSRKPLLLAFTLVLLLLVTIVSRRQQVTAALGDAQYPQYELLANAEIGQPFSETGVGEESTTVDAWQATIEQYITESWYRHAPGIDDFSTEDWLIQWRREFADCQVSYSGTTQPIGDAIDAIADAYGINRRVLLALLSLQLHSLRSEEPCESLDGTVSELDRMGNEMTQLQVLFRSGNREVEQSGADLALLEAWNIFPNDASFAVAHAVTVIASKHEQDPQALYQEFFQFFNQFFGDPEGAPPYLLSDETIDSVTYLMPFYAERPYTGGPHGGGAINPCDGVSLSDVSGIDFGSPDQSNDLQNAVVAIAPGKIVGIKYDTSTGSGGNWVAVQHDNGVVSMYWHLSSINSDLQINQYVLSGAYLGNVGDTGCSGFPTPCKPHIHVELRQGGSDYRTWTGMGAPVPWTERVIDGWRIYPEVYTEDNPDGNAGKAVNYYGTAVRDSAVNGNYQKKITIKCGVEDYEAYAGVEQNFPYGDEYLNTPNTKFAWADRRTRLPSTNNVHCPAPNAVIGSTLDSSDGLCGGGDTTPPSASGFSASVSGGRYAEITTSGVQDNSGGSGVREVRFSAKWGGNWNLIGADGSAPYTLSWDMCSSDVSNGDVELGMEVWDNAGNKWVWSEHYANPHITKQNTCDTPPGDKVRIYEHPNYASPMHAWQNAGSFNVPDNANDKTSSIWIESGWSVRVYEHDGGQGDSRCFAGSVGNLSDHGFDNKVSSIDIFAQSNCPPAPPSKPVLKSPEFGHNFVEGESILLEWYSVDNASEYYGDFWSTQGYQSFGWQSETLKSIGSPEPGYVYTWQVMARNSGGESSWSDASVFRVRTGTPTVTSIQALSCNSVILNWTNSSDKEDGYKVYRNGVEVGSLGANVTNFTDQGLQEHTDYSYIVKSHRNGMLSNPSDASNITTPACNVNLPDLVAFAPPGYEYEVVPSSYGGTHALNLLYSGVPTYFDWHFTNAGPVVAAGSFRVEVRVDNIQLTNQGFSNLAPNAIRGGDDLKGIVPSPNWHKVTLVIDPDNAIAESDETNNVWEHDFHWNAVSGWWGEYFPNPTFSGAPTFAKDYPVSAAFPGNLGFEAGGPPPGMPANNFSMKFSKRANVENGSYYFMDRHDVGSVTLSIDGAEVFSRGPYDDGSFHNPLIAGWHTLQYTTVVETGPAGYLLWIFLALPAPVLNPINNADHDGSYTVSWSSVPGDVSSYDLEERLNNGAWTGVPHPNNPLSVAVSDRADGQWCYRVQAMDSRMIPGEWSDEQCTSVTSRPDLVDLAPLGPNGYAVIPSMVKDSFFFFDGTLLYGGHPTYLDVHVLNIGGDVVGELSFAFDIQIDGAIWRSGELPIRNPGQSSSSFDWPVTLAPGDHVITFIVDPDDLVEESNEDNNTWEGTFTWRPVNGWWGEYFPNPDLSGDPVYVRDDETIDFNWGSNSPHANVPADNFSIRWMRTIYYPAGVYRCNLTRDDGARLLVDGSTVFERWEPGDETNTFDMTLDEGWHDFHLEYYEAYEGARLSLSCDQLAEPTFHLLLPAVLRR